MKMTENLFPYFRRFFKPGKRGLETFAWEMSIKG